MDKSSQHKMETLYSYGPTRLSLTLSFGCLISVVVLCALFLPTKPQKGLALSLDDGPPALIVILPNEAYNWQPTTVIITGAGFFTDTGTGSIFPTASLSNVTLTNVTFVNSATLTATVPADLPGGSHTLKVINPDGQSASLPSAFTVLHSGDGSLSLLST